CVGIEARAVVKLHFAPKGERDRLSVARGLPLLREPGDDVPLRVDADERVVHRVMDVPVDKETGEHWVEVRWIVLQRECQRAAVRRLCTGTRRRGPAAGRLLTASGEQDRQGTKNCREIAGGTHRHPPPEPTGFQGGYVRTLAAVQRPRRLETGVAMFLDFAALVDALAALPSE